MIREAIVLAGGLGTRLRSAVPDLPKCMAPVAGHPFLFHVLNYYRQQEITRFIFSLGYKHEVIEEYLQQKFSALDYSCVIENAPLGTGGAIFNAASLASSNDVLVLNGDTLFAVNVQDLSAFHKAKDADCTLSLKPMQNSDRYGVVETGAGGRIISFKEKKWYASSTINGGVYAVNLETFTHLPFEQVFSFEKDYLEKYYHDQKMFGLIQEGYFIDIGIPEDYSRAQTELQRN